MSEAETGGEDMEGSVTVRLEDVALQGELMVPEGAAGTIVFAHGSGSSRLSPRNRAVASALRTSERFGTLLFDLLTAEEDADYRTRFDIDLLTRRLIGATRWLAEQEPDSEVGFFGASTGAAAALKAAAELGGSVRAVVSRGGRPDLAGDTLARVGAPTLLIVGGNDPQVIQLNKQAKALMQTEVRLEIVPGASHLFEERGALEQVARLALDWFDRHLTKVPR